MRWHEFTMLGMPDADIALLVLLIPSTNYWQLNYLVVIMV